MLSDLRYFLSENVKHLLAPTRDVFGNLASSNATDHPARVIYTDGKIPARASGEAIIDAKATLWLFDHPRPISVGDLFELPDAQVLKVIGVERRQSGTDTYAKVYLS